MTNAIKKVQKKIRKLLSVISNLAPTKFLFIYFVKPGKIVKSFENGENEKMKKNKVSSFLAKNV